MSEKLDIITIGESLIELSTSENLNESVSEKNILSHLLNRYFNLEDYSIFKTEKNLFEHFFNLEEIC